MPARLRTWVEIDSWALRVNFRLFRRLVERSIAIAPVVKANAYGHGTLAVAQTLESEAIWGFCVASGEEGLALRKASKRPILVLSSWTEPELSNLIVARIQLVAWDLASARAIARVALRVGSRAQVHLKVDTGTSRIGVLPGRAVATARAIRQLPGIELTGVFSHFADSENTHWSFTQGQLERLRELQPRIRGAPFWHLACTAATLRLPDSRLNLVRLGIGLYGLWPSTETAAAVRPWFPANQLRPVLSWRTKLLQVKRLPAGTPVGYGLTFRTRRPTTLGVLPIGYWDGYDRALGNRAHVLVRGQPAPIIGRICMNLTMVDLTNVPRPKAGETVILLGQAGRGRAVTAEAVARWAGTINYEIVSRINPEIPRLLV